MTGITSIYFEASNGFKVVYSTRKLYVTDTNFDTWHFYPCCHIRLCDNHVIEGYLIPNNYPFDSHWFKQMCQALTEAYQRYNRLEEVMIQQKIKVQDFPD